MPDKKESEITQYFEQYWRYCLALRNWLVAFGVGLCMLVMSDRVSLPGYISDSTKKAIVALAFIGVLLQIILVFLNKVIHWYVYSGTECPKFQETKRYRFSDRLSECFWLDIGVDVLTIAIYLWAGYLLWKCMFI